MNRQQIYEKYMRHASIFIAGNILNFKLETISFIMTRVRCLMEKDIEGEINIPETDFDSIISYLLVNTDFFNSFCSNYIHDGNNYYKIRNDDRHGPLVTTMYAIYPKLVTILSDALISAVYNDDNESKKCGTLSDLKKCGIDFLEEHVDHKFLRDCAKERSCFKWVDSGWVMPTKKEQYELLKLKRDVMIVVNHLSRTNVDIKSTRVRLLPNPHAGNHPTLHVEHISSYFFRYFLEEYKLVLEEIEKKENISDRPCYELYWLITNMCPMSRGSASAAKVVLNAALHYLGFGMVIEKEEYRRQVDWVSMFSPDFENFYENKNSFFENL
uniref:Uncharacterized protein n=1 Tax=viral metagenome TaxID=1070528 RepID=A0A6C0KCV1_9ZZZZ